MTVIGSHAEWSSETSSSHTTNLALQFRRRLSTWHIVVATGNASHSLALQVLLCADMWKKQDMLHAAYCDREGVTEAFIKNGLRHAFGSLGCATAADPANWDYEVRMQLGAKSYSRQ